MTKTLREIETFPEHRRVLSSINSSKGGSPNKRANEPVKSTLPEETMPGPSASALASFGTLFVGLILAAPVAYAQARKEPTVRPWWVSFELGDGQVKLTSDQVRGTRNSAFALGGVGGHTLGNRARIGLELNGWLLQSFNLNNPAVGESVSNVLGVVDVFPVPKTPLFLRAGAGLALYTNNRPSGFNSHGWSWTAGLGYEIPLTKNFGLAPIVDYAAGSLGDVRNVITVDTRRRYSVVEFKAAVIWHFGVSR